MPIIGYRPPQQPLGNIMDKLFVIRNSDNDYLQVDFDSPELSESWVDYPEASWLSEFDADWHNEGRFEIVEVV